MEFPEWEHFKCDEHMELSPPTEHKKGVQFTVTPNHSNLNDHLMTSPHNGWCEDAHTQPIVVRSFVLFVTHENSRFIFISCFCLSGVFQSKNCNKFPLWCDETSGSSISLLVHLQCNGLRSHEDQSLIVLSYCISAW